MKNVPDFLERTIIHVNVFSFRYMVLMRVGDFQTKLSRFIRLCTGFLVSVVLVEKSVIFWLTVTAHFSWGSEVQPLHFTVWNLSRDEASGFYLHAS